jgi:uncharacterized repeat protein (TIGR01451 family)
MLHKILTFVPDLTLHDRNISLVKNIWRSEQLQRRLRYAFVGLVLILITCLMPAASITSSPTTKEVNIKSSTSRTIEWAIEELAVAADHIFIGQVQSVKADWNANKTSIETTVALSVREYLKSTTFPRDFTLVLAGDLVDEVSLAVQGTPTFVTDEGVLLFLKHEGETDTLVGNGQGVYHLEGNEAVQPETNRRLPLSALRNRIGAATETVPPPAYGGAIMLERSVEELAIEAKRILVADVLAIKSQFNTDRSSINTEVTLAVDKVLKGKANAQETLTLPGGHVGDHTILVGGVPNFMVGERVLLFLDNSEFAIAGMWQGKYSLSGDKAFQPETGLTVSVANLEQKISQALAAPVEIGTSPEIVHAVFTISCPGWSTAQSPVDHYVNSANPGSGSPTGASFVSLMYNSLHAWQDLSNSWVLLRVVGTGGDPTVHDDGLNVIGWDNLDGSGGTLGVNTCVYGGGTRFESDTCFDNSDTWTITAESGKIDLRSVAEHELGHGIGLGHSNQFCDGSASTPLMCAFINSGVRKTILADDSNGAADLYPLSGSPPNVPSNLSATSTGTSNLLNWTDNSGDELAFEIQRASGSCAGGFIGAATVPANTTSYTDDDYGVGLTGTYCYRVKALNRGGDSGFSNTSLNNPLSVNKRLVSTNVVTAGARITYTITIQNRDTQPVANTTVSDNIPYKTTYVPNSAEANPAIVDLTDFPTSTLPFTVSDSSTVVITYVLQVSDTVQRGDLLTNTATVSAPTFMQAIQVSSSNMVDPFIVYLPLMFKNN